MTNKEVKKRSAMLVLREDSVKTTRSHLRVCAEGMQVKKGPQQTLARTWSKQNIEDGMGKWRNLFGKTDIFF